MTDLILIGGLLYDGLGNAPLMSDIAITGDAISAIGDLKAAPASKIIEVSGMAVAPGFIDIHTHSDFSLFDNPNMISALAQGVTTEVVGNCGVSLALTSTDPVFQDELRRFMRGGRIPDWDNTAGYLTRLEELGIGGNICTLAGHGTIRKAVMGFEKGPPSPDQLLQMQTLLADSLAQGAVGFSTGLEYLPGGYADTAEQAALAQIAAEAGAFYATHMRNEGDNLVESVQEALTVARLANVPLQLSHHKAEGRKNWGKVAITLGMMDDARKAGMDILTDQYPYTAFMTGLSVIIMPQWALDGAFGEVPERLKDPSYRARVLADIEMEGWDWTTVQVGIARNRPEAQGMTLAALGKAEGKSPADSALDLLIDEEGWVSAVHFAMSEEDVEAVLRYPFTMIGSDGVAHDPTGPQANDHTHPRSFGTFPRVLSRYVRDRHVLSLSEAIRRMTTLPAQRLRLTDRGYLAVGKKADIVVFNPDQITDRATFDQPQQHPAGISHVIVNGRLAIEGGAALGTRAGVVLRRV